MTEYYFYARIPRNASTEVTSALRAAYCAYVKREGGQVERWPSGFPVLYVGPAVDGPEAERRIDCGTTFQKKDGKYNKAMRDLRPLPEETYVDKRYFIPLPQFDVFPPRAPFTKEEMTAGFLLAFPGADTDFIFAEVRRGVEPQPFIEQTAPMSKEQEVIRLIETQRWVTRVGAIGFRDLIATKMSVLAGTDKRYTPAAQAVAAYSSIVDASRPLDKYGLLPLTTSNEDKANAVDALVRLLSDIRAKGNQEARTAVVLAFLSDIYLRGREATDAASRAEAQSAWSAARDLLGDLSLLPAERAIVERIAQGAYTASTFRVPAPYTAPPSSPERQNQLLQSSLAKQKEAWLSAMEAVKKFEKQKKQASIEGEQTRVYLALGYRESYSKAPLEKKIYSIRSRLSGEQMEIRYAAISDMILLVRDQATSLIRFMHASTPNKLKQDAMSHMKKVWQDMCAYFMWAANIADLDVLGVVDEVILNGHGFASDEVAQEIPGTEFENYATEFDQYGVFSYTVKGKTTDDDYMALFRGIEKETDKLIKSTQSDFAQINSALYISREQQREILQKKFAGLREQREIRREEWRKKKEGEDKAKADKPASSIFSDIDIDLSSINEFSDFESPAATGGGSKGAKAAAAAEKKAEAASTPAAESEVDVLADFDFDLNPRPPGTVRRRFRRNPMKGSVQTQAWITRNDLKKNPTALYVFGDNLREQGYGGQAKEMRGEPNAVGIPTKRSPSMAPHAFFTNADLGEVGTIIDRKFAALRAHVDAGRDVIFPQDGLGTGLSELSRRAPAILAYINSHIQRLVAHSKA